MAERRDFRTELRAGQCSDIACGRPKICTCSLAAEMADEIERLRAALTEIKNLLGRPADPSERSVLRYAAFKTADVALADNIQHSTGDETGGRNG